MFFGFCFGFGFLFLPVLLSRDECVRIRWLQKWSFGGARGALVQIENQEEEEGKWWGEIDDD